MISDPNYQGSDTETLVIAQANATVTLGSLSATYDGTAKSATATTNPPNLNVTFTYNGNSSAPTTAGSYTVVGTISDPNYQGSDTETLVIAQANATVTLGSLSATYDGTPKSATAMTSPSGLNVTFTYNGSSNPPSAIGNYTVVGTINDTNYQGNATGTLVISSGGGGGGQTYSDWSTSYGLTGGPADMPENDGVPNLLKYLFDINPTVAMSTTDRAALPILGTLTVGNTDYLTLTYRQYSQFSGPTVSVQGSNDLVAWTTDTTPADQPTPTGQSDNSTNPPDPYMQVRVPITGAKQFIRLQVQQ
jgi:hypothetical protein